MVKIFTTENFEKEVLKAEKPVLVDFYADWCVPCKMMAPMVDELADELDGELITGKLNIDENMDIAQRYRVMSIPTLILFRGGTPSGRMTGVQDKETVLQMIHSV